MSNSGRAKDGDDRFYNRATVLGIVAICIFAVFYSIEFLREGRANQVWIVLLTSALCCLVIFLFRRAKGILNPALTVPFLLYFLYIAGSFVSGRFIGYFSVFFFLCGLALMYFNHWKFLLFVLLSNSVSLILIMAGVLGNASGLSFIEQLINWIFTAFTSLFMYMMIQFLSKTTGQAEKAEDSFKTMLSTTPDYIVLVNDLNYVTYISKPLAEFAHIEDPKMALGRPLLDIFREMDAKLKAAEILDSEGFYEGTWELTQDGEQRHFRIISNRLVGETPGLFISLMDITQLVKARFEAEAADRAKSSFLANTSHEIRTPMNAILGMAELILRKDITPDIYEDVTNIKQAGANLLGIINDVLDISKIESGKLTISPVKYHFSSLINDVISIIRMRLMEKRLDFIVRINGSLPSFLFGDEIRIRQVLLNLLNNAVKYTKEGSIRLTIFSREAPSEFEALNELSLVFEIADTGIGIKKEDLDDLFGEFKQFDAAANRGVEGTGLGLAISRNLCRLMGGDITVQSEYGKGSVFRAAIPQGIMDNSPYATVDDPKNKHVIFYENRKKHADALAYNVNGLGVRFSVAGSKEEFLSLLKADLSAYALVSSLLFAEMREELKTFGDGIKLAVLTGYDDVESHNDYHQLLTPVHPLTLSNFLNDETRSVLNYNKVPLVNFIIPSVRLLIVDDIATNLKVAEGLIEPYQATVDTCLNGETAISLVKKNKYDLVFMDHMMPIMDGVETTGEIREWEREKGNKVRIPIIALTANAVSGMREMYLENGFNDFLSKPIEMEKLDSILRKWIPPEKQQLKAVVETKQETVIEDSAIQIPGVDVKKGVAMTGGNINKYLKVLEMFRADAESRLPLLNNFAPKDSADFTAFATQVHALKSASASLGASELSEKAAGLEAAARKEDHDFIQRELPSFTASLETLAKNISEIKPEPQSIKADAPQVNVAHLLPALIALKKALVEQNQGEIDRLLEEFSKDTVASNVRKAAETISDQVLMAEFEEAMKTLEQIMIL